MDAQDTVERGVIEIARATARPDDSRVVDDSVDYAKSCHDPFRKRLDHRPVGGIGDNERELI